MLQYVDETLAALLAAEYGVEGVSVSFAGPDTDFPPPGVRLPALSFFLYEVRHNLRLRTGGPLDRELNEEVHFDGRPPPRVDCFYLITAWPGQSAPDPAADEHRMLGEVFRTLLRHRRIPAEYLRGELVGAQPLPPAKLVSDNELHSLGEFWQAMGGRPKAIVHYCLTVPVVVSAPQPVGRKVAEHRIEIDQRVTSG